MLFQMKILKDQVLSNSIFAVSKSGTISLQISSAIVPSIIIYKLSFINFMILDYWLMLSLLILLIL